MKWNSIWSDERGSTLILTALGIVVIIAFAGLSIDIGSVRSVKRHLQSAADAAALAGALEVSSCNGTSNCAAIQTAAQTSLAENGFTGSALLTNCTGTAGNALTLEVNNPPCLQQAGDPNTGKSQYVEVIASENQSTYFAGVLGFHSFPISVRAEAQRTPNPNCIYALDPSAGNAITVDLLASVNSSCGIVDESSAWNALSCNLIASVTASQITVTGGVQGLLCAPSTTPKTGVPVPNPADPLAWLPKPAIPACGSSLSSPYHGSSLPVLITLGSATLYPDGAYCQGIVIGPLATVTFMPGTYVIKSGGLLGAQGGLVVSPLANVTGTGVTFYNYGPQGAISFVATTANLGNINLTAPTTGTYAGILFFQDPGNTTAATFIASSDVNMVLQGAYYFPTAYVSYAASLPVAYNILVAKDIEFLALTFGHTANPSFSSNYKSLPNGSPLSGGGSVLVQ